MKLRFIAVAAFLILLFSACEPAPEDSQTTTTTTDSSALVGFPTFCHRKRCPPPSTTTTSIVPTTTGGTTTTTGSTTTTTGSTSTTSTSTSTSTTSTTSSTTTTSTTTTTIPSGTNCGLQKGGPVAFCETFDTAKGNGSRTGDLDPVLWGVSRIGDFNPGQGSLNSIVQTSMDGCGTTAWVFAPKDVRICNGKMFESINDGGGVQNLDTYPKQPFDFAGRTGTVAFDVSADSDGTHAAWPEFIITDKPVPGARSAISGVVGLNGYNEIGFTMSGCGWDTTLSGVATFMISRNGVYEEVNNNVPNFDQAFCVKQGTLTSLNHFEVRISTSRIEVWASDAGQSSLKMIGSLDNLDLKFTKGLVWLSDAHYNARKSTLCDNGEPHCGTQWNHTFAWDNLAFDGPKTYRDLGYDIPDSLEVPGSLSNEGEPRINTGYFIGTNTVTFTLSNVHWAQQPTGALVVLNSYSFEQNIVSVSVNGNAFINTPFPVDGTTFMAHSISIPIPLDQVKDGTNTLTFKGADDSIIIANVSLIIVAGAPVP